MQWPAPMARKLRIEYPGAIYHAMSRGNHRDALLHVEQDWNRLPKSEPIKEVLAWWLRSRTTESCRWISDRLCMGHEADVSRAVRRVAEPRGRKVRSWKRKLLRSAAGQGG